MGTGLDDVAASLLRPLSGIDTPIPEVAIVVGTRDRKLGLAGRALRQLMDERNQEAAAVGMTLVLLLRAELNAASAQSP